MKPDNVTMWAVLINGSDDIYPLPDKECAEALALVLNHQFQHHPAYYDPLGCMLRAEVTEWPYDYESWSAEKDLTRFEVIPAK